jgi:adenosylmethionine-8-amino-7-oxononanoate aminotransferase
MDLLLEPETEENLHRIESKHKDFAEKITSHKKVKCIRQTGTILAIEWDTTGETSYFNGLRDTLYNFFLDQGIILRPLGNIIYIMPPYCIKNEDLDYIYAKIEEALERF